MPFLHKLFFENYAFRFWVLAILIVLILLTIAAVQRQSDYWHSQYNLVDASVREAADEIASFLESQSEAVSLFSQNESVPLIQLLQQPDNSEASAIVWERFKNKFPRITSLGLTDNYNRLRFSFGTFAEDGALPHILLFTRGMHPPAALHGRDLPDRYDVIFPWRYEGERRGVLYAAFNTEDILALLKNRPASGAMVVLRPARDRAGIDIHPEGFQRPLHLYGADASARIDDLPWEIAAHVDSSVMKKHFKGILLDSVALLAVFLLFSVFLYGFIRRQEKGLVQQHRRYQDLLETSEDIVWSLDDAGYFTWVNDEAQRILGYSPAQMIGKPFISFSREDEIKRDMETLAQAMHGTPVRHHVTRQIHADGHDVYLSYNAIPLRDRTGKITGITGTASNITPRVETMRTLRQKEVRYRQMFEQNHAVKLILDSGSGRIIEANSAASEYFGYPPEKLADMNIRELADPSVENQQRLNVALLEQRTAFEIQPRLADGSFRNVEVISGPIQVGGEEQLYLILRDITQRTLSEKALSDSEEKLRAIVDSSAEGIIMTTATGDVELFNPAAQIMFGYLPEDILGENINRLLPEQEDENADAGLRDFFSPLARYKQEPARETLGLRRDHSEFPIRISLSSVALDEHRHVVAMVQDITEQRDSQKRFTYIEQHDLLTGLLNRREFERRLDFLITGDEEEEHEHSLCYIDIDQFQVINDTNSHAAGDALLKQMATLIRAQLRETELIGRLGGDEFGVVLTECSLDRAVEQCESLIQTVRNFVFSWRDRSVDIGISIGIASFNARNDSSSSVLSAADVACHMAKTQGRNRIHVYHSGDIELSRRHGDMRLVPRINQALSEERFRLFAQPIAAVAQTFKARAHHYEVLVRMVDEQGRLVIPTSFIPAAERYILMPAIDRWIVNHLFSTQGENLRRWAVRNGGRHEFLFAINLSATSLTDDGFLSYLRRQFSQWDIPCTAICFEVTETAAISNLSRARQLIDELKVMGCSIALDDFGSGASSYRYLKELPVDFLKIDGSFVRNMKDDPVDHAMVDSINQIAHILGLKTIAEWAEDKATLNQLRALNVDFAQGYAVGEPLALEEFRLAH